jgi:hypothetical protein
MVLSLLFARIDRLIRESIPLSWIMARVPQFFSSGRFIRSIVLIDP